MASYENRIEVDEFSLVVNCSSETITDQSTDGSSSSSIPTTQNKKTQRQCFVDSINNLLLQRNKKDLQKFHLSFSDPQDFELEVEKWIKYAIDSKVKELSLDFSKETWDSPEPNDPKFSKFDLPNFVYQYEHFESLKLFACNVVISSFQNLSTIKKLYLGWISLPSSSFQKLISSCPFLEILVLKKCRNINELNIGYNNCQNLTSLEIDDCTPLEYGMNVFVESLKYFTFRGYYSPFGLEKFTNLEKAELQFGHLTDEDFGFGGEEVCNTLRALESAKVLTVCNFVTQVVPNGEEPISLKPPLSGVKHLILKTDLHTHEVEGIVFLLRSCPSLEKLSIQTERIQTLYCDLETSLRPKALWRNSSIFPIRCLKTSLKEVIVEQYRGEENEFGMLEHLLQQCTCLEIMTIHTSTVNGIHTRKSADKLLMVERASRSAMILIR